MRGEADDEEDIAEGDSEDVGHLLVHVFLLRIAARLHPVLDDMDLFTVETTSFGFKVLRVASSASESKTPWILSVHANYFVCDRKSHGGASSTNRSMRSGCMRSSESRY